MNAFETVSKIHAPAAFAACVQSAARRAVQKSPSRLVYPMRIALITLLLFSLAAGAFAVVRSITAGDLFSDASGFSLPDLKWGESASVPRPSTIVFMEHTGEIFYQSFFVIIAATRRAFLQLRGGSLRYPCRPLRR